MSTTTSLTNTCTSFQWMIVEIVGTSGSGTFTTTCMGNIQGTATYDGTQFRIPYSGPTCLGPVSGTTLLRKN